MTKFKIIRLKNAMLLANAISNIIGVSIVIFLVQRTGTPPLPEVMQLSDRINVVFIPCAFLLPTVLTVMYERPIRRCLDLIYRQESVSKDLDIEARRRLLNEPFFLIILDACIWLFSAVLYPLLFWIFDAGHDVIYRSFFLSFFTGLITITVAFFVFEHVLQKRVVPSFFPQGGLYRTPRTLRISIRTRLIALLFACNLIPFIAMMNMALEIFHVRSTPLQIIDQLRSSIFISSLIFMGVGIWLTILVSSNLKNPLQEIIRVLHGVRNGNFDDCVRVTSNDEIGYTGDVINEMNMGLKERDFIKDTFGKYVAKEVRDEILSRRVPLDGEKKDVTILFSDLRNFTPMVEGNDPKLVIRIMNSYFKEMAEAIQGHGGLVLQFIGDEIYAVFGAPIFDPEHPAKAFLAGLEMRRRLVALNRVFEARGWPGLKQGIGIHSGEALAASMGSPDRLSYLLVGDTVNLASRLQSLTKDVGTEMILSAATYARLNESGVNTTRLKQMPPTSVKGKAQPVEIYALG